MTKTVKRVIVSEGEVEVTQAAVVKNNYKKGAVSFNCFIHCVHVVV